MRFYALFTTFKPSRPILMDEIDKIYNFKGKLQVLSGRKVKPEMQVQVGFYFS